MSLRKKILLVTVPSDSHSWNLVFMELLLRDLGCDVENMGPNTPVDEVLIRLSRDDHDMVVVSTVNGHGYIEGAELARRIRNETGYEKDIYIGGKICTENDPYIISQHYSALKSSGFDAVFDDSMGGSFDAFQKTIAMRFCKQTSAGQRMVI